MPIREYNMDDGGVVELLADHHPDTIELPDGRTGTLREISLVARTADRWGDTGQRPYFNRGLGCYVSGEREAAKIAKERGLVCWRELGTEREVDDMFKSQFSKAKDASSARDAEFREYEQNVQRYGKLRAAAETWSLSRIANGQSVFSKS